MDGDRRRYDSLLAMSINHPGHTRLTTSRQRLINWARQVLPAEGTLIPRPREPVGPCWGQGRGLRRGGPHAQGHLRPLPQPGRRSASDFWLLGAKANFLDLSAPRWELPELSPLPPGGALAGSAGAPRRVRVKHAAGPGRGPADKSNCWRLPGTSWTQRAGWRASPPPPPPQGTAGVQRPETEASGGTEELPVAAPPSYAGASPHFLCLLSSHFSSVQSPSRVGLFATPWTAARQASMSVANSRVYSSPLSW